MRMDISVREGLQLVFFLGGSSVGLGWIIIILYGLLGKTEIGFCGAGWNGIN